MNAVEIAWVAGIIEGEGTILVPGGGQYPSVRVAMTDEDVVRRLHSITGLGRVVPRKKGQPHFKPQWQWHVCSRREVARLLCAVAPLMGSRRTARIAEAADRLARPPRNIGQRPTTPHGTATRARHHYRNGEKPCEPCRLAINADTVRRQAKRRNAS